MSSYGRSVYLAILFSLAMFALPNSRQQTFGPDELASWTPAHAEPLPNHSDDSMEFLMTRTSDILCERVYAFWSRFLRQRFDPPIEDAVQSTNVDWWEEARYGKRYLRVDCLDIRSPLNWIRVNARQLREHLRSVEAHRENPEDVPEVWQWLREQSEQGTWIMECWPRHIPYKRNRINALGSPDTWGFCLPPDETPEDDSSSTPLPTATPVATKEWYDTDLSLRHVNNPWRAEALPLPLPKRQKGYEVTCADVLMDQAGLVKGGITLILALGSSRFHTWSTKSRSETGRWALPLRFPLTV